MVFLSRDGAMAEGPDPNVKDLKEPDEDITCAMCYGHYQEATLLPCNHYYCRACAESLATCSRECPFPCPECLKDDTLPLGGVEQLQSVFLDEKMAEIEGKVEAVCEQCSEGKLVAFCRQCNEFICAECTTLHENMRALAEHKITTLEDPEGGAKDVTVKEASSAKCPEHDKPLAEHKITTLEDPEGGAKDVTVKEASSAKCPEHDKPMKITCFDCNRLICRDCVLVDHRKHKSDFLKKYVTESRKTLLLDSLTPLRKIQANIAGTTKKLAGTRAEISAQREEACETIKQSFDRLKAALDQQENEMVKKVRTMAQAKKDALDAQREGLQRAEDKIQSLVVLVERNVEYTSDLDLMVIHTQLQAKVEEERKRQEQLCLDPTTTGDLQVYHHR